MHLIRKLKNESSHLSKRVYILMIQYKSLHLTMKNLVSLGYRSYYILLSNKVKKLGMLL